MLQEKLLWQSMKPAYLDCWSSDPWFWTAFIASVHRRSDSDSVSIYFNWDRSKDANVIEPSNNLTSAVMTYSTDISSLKQLAG
jgi:hypothetical protein